MKIVSEEDGQTLLTLAFKTLIPTESSCPPLTCDTTEFGLFVALKKQHQLRGCIGTPYLTQTLSKSVQELTRLAATEDSRFPPVTPEEIPDLTLEVSLLSQPKPIEPKQIELGRHGVLIHEEEHAALFLPEVPTQKNWSRETLLEELCLKADLPKDAWKKLDVLAFETQVFKSAAEDLLQPAMSLSLQDE